MAEFIVLGAGMVGVSSALALQEQGHQVILVDRKEPGEETSFGNAGIIQAEAVEPYAWPRDFMTLWRYAIGDTNDVVWKLGASVKMTPALWQYFQNSSSTRYPAISMLYAQLAGRSIADHGTLIEQAGAQDLILKQGLAMLYRDEPSFKEACAKAKRLHDQYGLESRIQDGPSYQTEEPALIQAPVGVVHWLPSWSCKDPGGLTQAYANLFVARGGELCHGDANSLQQTSTGWQMDTEHGAISAEQVVIALGPWTPEFLKRFDYSIPMVYKRGYHGHYKVTTPLNRPFLDVANGVLAAPMNRGIRVTSGAALVDLNSSSEPVQLERGVDALRTILSMGDRVRENQWYGTRPCMPDMLPVVGKAPRHANMWWHFGHGHQGFTQGPTTAKLLVQAILGESSELLTALSPQRLI